MAELLGAPERHDGDEIAHVQAGRRRIESAVRGDFFAREQVARALGGVGHLAAPLKFVEKTAHECSAGSQHVFYLGNGVPGSLEVLEAPEAIREAHFAWAQR